MQKVGKGSLLLVTALVLSLVLAGSVWAQMKGPGRGGGNLTPEQAGKIFDLKEKFNADTVSLRRQMTVKQAELQALSGAEKPDQKATEAKNKELQALREQMQEKMKAFQQEVKKIAPEIGMGMGPGHGMGGPPPMPPGGKPGPKPPPPPAKP